ncbi:DUF928 domain-containing protein [Leptolyngbya sp. DQ-M1]|uniref:DUF928 domain-containing protein n=1 Tax=Leptolyngbya sp. DQ-M1 TaxID=2933920 RepID=UPI003296884F
MLPTFDNGGARVVQLRLRVSPNPSLSQQIQQAEFRQKVRLYAENGIWFDAVATLAEARSVNPKDAELAKDWEQLLQA